MKTITPHFDRSSGRLEVEYAASYDGNLIGYFRTNHEAEIALNDYALDLAQQGLLDAPLAAIDELGDDDPWPSHPCNICGQGSDLCINHDGRFMFYCSAHEPAEPDSNAPELNDTALDQLYERDGFLPLAAGAAYEPPTDAPGNDCPDHGPGTGDCDKCANPGRAIARHWHRTPRRFVAVLRALDPVAWWPLAEAYSAWRGCSTQHTLDIWLLATQGTQVPASARA